MEKINYQLITDSIINGLTESGKKERLLLHACCAPCATYVLEYLSLYFDITVFFCNPNITDPNEYSKRLGELYRLIGNAPFCKGISIIEDNLPSSAFFEVARGFESEPEGGARCEKCFRLRIERTAELAKREGFDRFATTLTVSPHKNAALINGIGAECEKRFGSPYLPSDFKKRGGYQRSVVLCRDYGIYRQQYCGCVFSEHAD